MYQSATSLQGMYQFTLTVYDDKNLFSSDSVFVNVSTNPHATDIVEVMELALAGWGRGGGGLLHLNIKVLKSCPFDHNLTILLFQVFLFDTPDSFTQQRLDSLSNILMVPLG